VNRLSKLLDYMIEEDYIQKNPCEKVKKLRVQKKIVYPLNDSEIRQMLAIASKNRSKEIGQRNVKMLSLMLDAGLRINEVMSLKTEDILENQILIRNAKGNKDRAVALTPILKKEMRKYKRLKDKTRYRDCEYFFVSQRGTKGTTKIGAEIMQEIKKQMDVRSVVRFSPHTLRHTYAHMCMRNGMDIYTLSKNMGHSSVTMTQNYLQTLKSDDFVKESIKYSTLQNLR
ncbi:site-specific integrase, partial [bacterium]|nr:site-specific integrase [bacterium]